MIKSCIVEENHYLNFLGLWDIRSFLDTILEMFLNKSLGF